MKAPNHPFDGSELLAHAAWLQRLARALIADPSAAEDAAQDTWVAALRDPPDDDRPVRPWLAVVLRNFARMRARASAYDAERGRRAAALTAPEELPSAEALLQRHELLRIVAALVSELDEPYRSTILLWAEEGLEPSEIARRVGVPAGTVRWRLKRGLDDLRQELDRRHGGDRRAWCAALMPLVARPWGGGIAAAGKGILIVQAKSKIVLGGVLLMALLLGGAGLWWRGGGFGGTARDEHGRSSDLVGRPEWAKLGTGAIDEPGLGTASVEGRVLDPDGSPVPEATVSASPRLTAWDPTATRVDVPTLAVAVSDSEGRYRLAGLPAGSFGISGTASGFAATYRGPLDLRSGEHASAIDLRLGRDGVVLSGTVTDSGGGPVGGARVLVVAHAPDGVTFGAASIRLFAARAAGDGQYRISLPAGLYDIVADAEGYAPTTLLQVPISADLTRNMRLHPGATLTGHVVQRGTREPIAGADITLLGGRAGAAVRQQRRIAVATSDHGGGFTFSRLEPGSYDVAARKAGWAGRTAGPVSVVVAGTSSEVVVEMAERASLSGQVRAASGKPLEGATVLVGKVPDPRRALDEVTVAADGSYRVEGLVPGDYWVWGRAPGHSPQRRLVALADQGIGGFDFTLPDGATIAGKVTGSDGTAIAGAGVQASCQAPGDARGAVAFVQATTSPDGSFRLSGLAPGPVTVEALHPERGSARQGPLVLAPGERKQVNLTLDQNAYAVGVVRWDDGKPAAGIIVRGFIDPLSEITTRSASTGGDGRFRVGPFSNGTVRLVATRTEAVRPRGTGPETQEVVVTGGNDTDAGVLVLARGVNTIRGTVRDPEGRPVPGALIRAAAESSDAAGRGTEPIEEISGLDGRFTLDGLAAGAYTVGARQPGFPAATVRNVLAGGPAVDIRLERGSVLAGQVVRSNGQPITAFTLAVLPSDKSSTTGSKTGDRERVVTEEHPFESIEGWFAINGLAANTYDVIITSVVGGLSGGLVAVQLAPGQERRDLRVTLDEGATVKGHVVDESGRPMVGVRLLLDSPGKSPRGESDRSGAFAIKGVPIGPRLRIDVLPTAAGYATDPLYVRVASGQVEVDVGVIPLKRRGS